MALIAIPFRSLRFRSDGSDWGVVFQRNFPRNSESDFWPRISTNITGVLSQEGTLKGIEGVTGSHNAQINPYVLGQNERELKTIDPLNPYFSSRHMEGTAGGEVKAILKDRIIFDATINPDFSTVESDQPQFTVDQRYPVYFPELRPFFLENANYFATPINLVYTRNIVHPEYGGRVTGKIATHQPGIVCHRRPGAGADGGAWRSALQQAGKDCRGASVAGPGQRIEHRRDLYRLRVWPGMEPHRGRGFYLADNQKMDSDGADGGELDQRHGGQRNSAGVCRRAGEQFSVAAQRTLVQPVFDLPGYERGLPNAVGIYSGIEFPQRPDAHEVPVVSEAPNDPELRLWRPTRTSPTIITATASFITRPTMLLLLCRATLC